MKTGKEGVGEEAAGAASLPPRTAQSFVGKRLGGGEDDRGRLWVDREEWLEE